MASNLVPLFTRSNRRLLMAVLTVTCFLATSPSSRADTIDFFSQPGTEGLGSFSGTLTVTNSIVSGTYQSVVNFSITNTTTPASNGGVITGMAFNDPSGSAGLIKSVTLNSVKVDGTTYTSKYSLFGGSNYYDGVSGQPYGQYDVGAGTGTSFLGGSTLNGIGTADPGETVDFKFTIKWDSAYTPTAADFMSALSTGGSETSALLVRYQGFCVAGGSDKVPSTGGDTPPPTGAVPAPPALLLGLIGMGCGVFGRGFRRRLAKDAAQV